MDETKQAQEIVYQLRNPDVLRKVIEMMKISMERIINLKLLRTIQARNQLRRGQIIVITI